VPCFDFMCPTHGEFEQICLATVDNPHAGTETQSAACPECGKDSPRTILQGDNVPFGAAVPGKQYRYHTRFHFNFMES
jgi:hypothetical protein